MVSGTIRKRRVAGVGRVTLVNPTSDHLTRYASKLTKRPTLLRAACYESGSLLIAVVACYWASPTSHYRSQCRVISECP